MTRTQTLSAALALGMFLAAAPAAEAQTAAPAQTPAPAAAGGDLDPRIHKLIASISEERMKTLLTKLSSFTTRNTMSDPDLPNGLGAARQWILDEMTKTSPKLQVSFDTHTIPASGRITRDVELRNIIAVLPGKSPLRIYVSGHYDSLNIPGQSGRAEGATPAGPGAGRANQGANTQAAAANTQATGRGAGAGAAGQDAAAGRGRGQQPPPNYNVVAPGANDDGSGTVLSMELARVFAESGIEFEATLVFMTVAGEEQGLIGSTAHARRMKEQKVPVQALFNNDIVGNSTGGNGIVDGATVKVYSEGPEDSPSRSLANFAKRIAERYVPSHEIRLMARRDRFGRGGDHSGFNAEGFAAIGFRESKENYSKQHNANDTIDGVAFPYLAQNARANAAGMAVLALAPPPPEVRPNMLTRRPSGYDANLRWTASPNAVGYRIFWRKAWAPDWEHELYVGNVTEFLMANKNIDDHVFGVAAVGPGGHESTISAYVMAPRND
ncbi:MAG: M20/M25/M40 family metallo-hydrolase [Acidobacteriota bacterium]|nr:M20/M25/M40 family metallo-hydrolase [Acidobacteriota bacterium]